MLIDRLLFIYTGLALFMIAKYAFRPTCGVTAGFYLWMSIIVSASRPVNQDIYKYDIGIELLIFLWSIYELYPLCYETLVLCYVIFTSFNHFISIFYYMYKYTRRDVPGVTRPLISEMDEFSSL